MRLRVALFALLLSACTSAGPSHGPAIRVMVYNIHAGKDAGGVDNLERVAALITSSRADIVLLQEVDRGTQRSGKVDQVEVLTRLTKMHGAFGKSLDYQGGLYGIATLSRWPIRAEQTVHLPVDPPQARAGGSIEPRVALLIETELPSGPIVVSNTHLDASREHTYRLQEIGDLLETFAKRKPLLAGGDFNSEPDSPIYEQVRRSGMRDSWVECGQGSPLTFPAKGPVKRIDYLFLSGTARCTSAKVLETEASDHRPVWIEVALN